MEILASRMLFRPADYQRSLSFYRDQIGLAIAREARPEPWGLREMHVTDPDGVTLIFVEIPGDHPLRRDTRAQRRR